MTSSNQILSLIEFVQKATKLGKYNSNTGLGILNAIRAAEKGFSPEEPREIDYLISHIEELFFRQKELNLSPQSQAVYFTRIKRGVADYKKYGTDARAIYAWSPKIRTKKTKKNAKEEDDTLDSNASVKLNNQPNEIVIASNGVRLNVVTWRLRPGVLIKVELPEDLTEQDVVKIKKLLDLEID